MRANGKNTHTTLLRLGEVSELRESGQLGRIIRALSQYATEDWVNAGDLGGGSAPSLGAVAAVYSHFCRLGLEEYFSRVERARGSMGLSDTVFVLLANRLLEPFSKRRTVKEWLKTVSLPEGVEAPKLGRCSRCLDALKDSKQETEAEFYHALCDLTNLDLRLMCYDVTSTYFETHRVGTKTFPSLDFGYSRDHRSDLPQVVVGLLVTSDGIPIAHHVFAGNTSDAKTLPAVMEDLRDRFSVGKIALVADRGLISEDNLAEIAAKGFDHVMATRLHNDNDVRAVLEQAISPTTSWVPVEEVNTFATEVTQAGQRYVVCFSPARYLRDKLRHGVLVSRTEEALIALAPRARKGHLSDKGQIAASADRILHDSGVARCFEVTAEGGFFSWNYDEAARRYDEELLCGRYVISTSLSLTEAPTAKVVSYYRSLWRIERRLRVMKDFISLRPVYLWTEDHVCGHIALCVLVTTIEVLIAKELAEAGVMDPDLTRQHLSLRRALAELGEVRRQFITAGARTVDLVSRRSLFQQQVLKALRVVTSAWGKANIA
jgi:transposase